MQALVMTYRKKGWSCAQARGTASMRRMVPPQCGGITEVGEIAKKPNWPATKAA